MTRHIHITLHAALLALLIVLTTAAAHASLKLTEVSTWGGTSNGVAVSGNYAYLGAGNYLSVLDISNASSPVKVGSLAVCGTVLAVASSGSIVCVTTENGFLVVADVSDPAHPAKLGSYSGLSNKNYWDQYSLGAYEVKISGNCAYVIDAQMLRIFNIADPIHPTLVGGYGIWNYGSGLGGVAVTGDHAYVMSDNSLTTLDISNPSHPQQVNVSSGPRGFGRLVIAGNRLCRTYSGRLYVYDLTNSAAPAYVGYADATTGSTKNCLAVSGNYAYIGDPDHSAVSVFSIAPDGTPTFIRQVAVQSRAADLAVSGNKLIAAGGPTESRVLDISDPSSPVPIGCYSNGYVIAVDMSGPVVAAACWQSRSYNYSHGGILRVLNAADPAHIAAVGSCPLPFDASPYPLSDNPRAVRIAGTKACVETQGGAYIIDIVDPANPIRVGSYVLSQSWDSTPVDNIDILGNYAFIAHDRGLVRIDLAAPAILGQYVNYWEYCYAPALRISGNTAYLGDTDWFATVDITTPDITTTIGDIQETANSIRLSGNYAYVANDGFSIIDVSDPTSPTVRSHWSIPGSNCTGIAQFGNRVCLATPSGVQAFDVSSLTNPLPAGNLDMGSRVISLSGPSNGVIYAVTDNGVLHAMQFEESDLCCVYGHIADSSGAPMTGATVAVSPGGTSTVTDSSGYYVAYYVPSDELTLTVSQSGWTSISHNVTVPAGSTAQQDFVFQRGTIAVSVTDDLGQPVVGAAVQATGISGQLVASAVSGSDGNCLLDELLPGVYTVQSSRAGYIPASSTLTVIGGQTTACSLALVRLSCISGVVRDSLGIPISGVSVQSGSYSTTTDSAGHYSISNMLPSTYTWTVSASGWTSKTAVLQLKPGDSAVLDFTLALGTAQGTVLSTMNVPLSGVTVTISPGGSSMTTGIDGQYTFASLRPGAYSITANRDASLACGSVTIVGGQSSGPALTLTVPGSVFGVVRNTYGRCVDGAVITLSGSSGTFVTSTDSAGNYAFNNMTPYLQGYDITITQLGYLDIADHVTIHDGEGLKHDFTAADGTVMDRIGGVGIAAYYPNAIATVGNLACVTYAFNGFCVIDLSDPAHPARLGTLTFSETPTGVAASGHYAYLAVGGSGMVVVDFANPTSPRVVGTYDTSGTATGIALSGSYVYVADGQSGLQVISVADPTHPVRVGGYQASGFSRGVAVSGGLAYLVGAEVDVINVSNPSSPVRLGTLPSSVYLPNLAVDGSYLYVIAGTNELRVIDVHNSAVPTSAGRITLSGGACGVAVSNGRAFVAGGYAGTVSIVDVTVPTTPCLAGVLKCAAPNVALWGNYVLLAESADSIGVYTVDTPRVSAIYPSAAANSGVAVITDLHGLCLKQGSVVKLTRSGHPDISAFGVTRLDTSQLTCSIDLSGADTGLWNVVVTNPDGQTATLPNAFAVVLSNTSPVVGSTAIGLSDPIVGIACRSRRFALWGRVAFLPDHSGFTLDDGSRSPVTVFAPGSSGISDGDYVRAAGTVDLSSGSPQLLSSADEITKLN